MLLWIEDIHWADRSTRSFLRFLAASLTEERVVVVATYRSDELHRRHPLRPLLAELERSPRARRIELERFDRGEVADQLADILGAAPRRDVVERMYGRSEGNPLFTEELLAAGVDGRGSLPPSLREALLLRVERLPGEPSACCACSPSAAAPDRSCSPRRPASTRGALRRDPRGDRRRRSSWSTVPGGTASVMRCSARCLRRPAPGERSELHLVYAHALERVGGRGRRGLDGHRDRPPLLLRRRPAAGAASRAGGGAAGAPARLR